MTFWYPGVIEIIALLNEIYPGIPVILGGIYASLCTDHARQNCGADYVIPGPAESSLPLILDILGSKSSPVCPDDEWRPLYPLYPLLTSAAVLTSRGCPYHCPFCASGLLGSYRKRSADAAVSEIEWLADRNVRHIAFYDDALLFRKEEHIIPILERVSEKCSGTQFHTPNGLQPREIDRRVAGLMKKTGFSTLRLSYETRNPQRQLQMSGKIKDEDMAQAVDCLFGAGFSPEMLRSYIMMGLPGQPLEEVIESLLFVLGLGIRVSLASFSPIPGTVSWKEAVEQGLIGIDSDPLIGNNTVYAALYAGWGFGTCFRLGSLVASANQMILRGLSPLRDAAFLRSLESFHANPRT